MKKKEKKEIKQIMLCTKCKHTIYLDDENNFENDEHLGKVVRCGKCGSRHLVSAKVCEVCNTVIPLTQPCWYCTTVLTSKFFKVFEEKGSKELFEFNKYRCDIQSGSENSLKVDIYRKEDFGLLHLATKFVPSYITSIDASACSLIEEMTKEAIV